MCRCLCAEVSQSPTRFPPFNNYPWRQKYTLSRKYGLICLCFHAYLHIYVFVCACVLYIIHTYKHNCRPLIAAAHDHLTCLILFHSLFVSSLRVASLRMCQTDMLNAVLNKCFPPQCFAPRFAFPRNPFRAGSLLLSEIITFLNRHICTLVIVGCVSCIYTRPYKFGYALIVVCVIAKVNAKHFCCRNISGFLPLNTFLSFHDFF